MSIVIRIIAMLHYTLETQAICSLHCAF